MIELNQVPTGEIVRSEFFSGVGEPAITIKKPMVKFSASCLSQMADVDYILFMIFPTEKKLVIEPCAPELRSAIRWSSLNPDKRTPKTITCREFYRRIRALMEWDEDCRYKVFGKVSGDGEGEKVFVFDLTSALVFRPDAGGRISNRPDYPPGWDDGFGMTKAEHFSNPLLRRFDEDTVIDASTESNNHLMQEDVTES